MWNSYYAAHLAVWNLLTRWAATGRLADGSPMPPAVKLAIQMRAPIVNALVTQGRALDASDISGNFEVVRRLSEQWHAVRDIVEVYGLLPVLMDVVAPVLSLMHGAAENVIAAAPSIARDMRKFLKDFSIGAGLGVGTAVALGIGALILFRALEH